MLPAGRGQTFGGRWLTAGARRRSGRRAVGQDGGLVTGGGGRGGWPNEAFAMEPVQVAEGDE